MITEIIKRDGRRAPFQIEKITDAIYAAAQASGGRDREMAERLAQQVVQLHKRVATTLIANRLRDLVGVQHHRLFGAFSQVLTQLYGRYLKA